MKKITLSWQPIQHSSFMPQQENSMLKIAMLMRFWRNRLTQE